MTVQSSIARIELPWPPKDVSPNARGHYMKRARAIKAYRDACGWECVAQNVKPIQADRISYTLKFHRPTNLGPWPDDDNLIGSMKAARDAVAAHIGIDDRHWTFAGMVKASPKKPYGCVVMELEAA